MGGTLEEGGSDHGGRRRHVVGNAEATLRPGEVGKVVAVLRQRGIDLRGTHAGESTGDDRHDA